jgi:hypothetical protein
MPEKYHFLRIALIAALLPAIVGGKTGPEDPALTEQTLEAIRNCMARSPAPWPDEWKQQYLETIRRAVESHEDVPHSAARLEILRKGFGPYWESLKKSKERSSFEVHLAGIRWYTEHLMDAKLPGRDERQKLRVQYKDLWDHAASSPLTQFPFLDPNTVRLAKADHLSQCYLKIEAPLLPIYLHPFSETQMGRIKKRWYDLRYARVDLWRQLGGETVIEIDEQQVKIGPEHPHYLLTQRSLTQLTASIRPILSPAPEYYIEAVNRRKQELMRLQQANATASRHENLQKSRYRQILQAEQISFLLKALLESPSCFDESKSKRSQGSSTSVQNLPAKGGDAYELNNVSQEK